jgi:hypothetical protein
MSKVISKGDRFVWNGGVYVEVRRVAKDQTWADLKCNTLPDIDASPGWTKRQKLPLTSNFQPWQPGTQPVTYLIWSNHHGCWWGPNGCGYRTHIADAGRYALEATPQWLGRGCGCCRVPEVLVPMPTGQVLFDPDALAEYARSAPRRATRQAVKAGQVNRYAEAGAR